MHDIHDEAIQSEGIENVLLPTSDNEKTSVLNPLPNAPNRDKPIVPKTGRLVKALQRLDLLLTSKVVLSQHSPTQQGGGDVASMI